MIRRLVFGVACAVLALIGAANATIVTNGDFATGDFSGWTLFTTPNGSLGPPGSGLPAVTSFDVTGSGAQNAATFQVGAIVLDGSQQGGGIAQTVTLPGGVISFSASIAAQSAGFNDEFGVFSVLLAGVTEDTVDLGSAMFGTIRGTLSFMTTESAGAHMLEILITRPFRNPIDETPLQYVTNIAISGTAAVPEPTSLVLLAAGLLGFAAVRRSR